MTNLEHDYELTLCTFILFIACQLLLKPIIWKPCTREIMYKRTKE